MGLEVEGDTVGEMPLPRGCGTAVSYGAGSDNEISASSLPSFQFLIILGSSADCTLPLAGFKHLKGLLADTVDHHLVLFILTSERVCVWKEHKDNLDYLSAEIHVTTDALNLPDHISCPHSKLLC